MGSWPSINWRIPSNQNSDNPDFWRASPTSPGSTTIFLNPPLPLGKETRDFESKEPPLIVSHQSAESTSYLVLVLATNDLNRICGG